MDLCSASDIRGLLERHGFRFSKKLGQNFLTAGWVPERIVSEADIRPDSGVLEIGPGIGCLTVRLAAAAGRVAAVELDRALMPVLSETLGGCHNVSVINADILKLDLTGLVSREFSGLRPEVCANLPYNITTPVLTALIDSGLFGRITVMIQREVARRMCAAAGTPEYGAFTIYVNYHTVPELLFDVPPGCFIPQPKVTSSVIKLTRRERPPVGADRELFFRVVRAAFSQRRKTLVNCLHHTFGGFSKEELGRLVTGCGFGEMVRGEALDIQAFAALSDALGRTGRV